MSRHGLSRGQRRERTAIRVEAMRAAVDRSVDEHVGVFRVVRFRVRDIAAIYSVPLRFVVSWPSRWAVRHP